MRRIVESLDQPAYVTGQRWDVLAWNRAAADILVDFETIAADNRNILLFMLLDPEAKRRFGPGWAAEAGRMVAQFRMTHDLWAGDPAFAVLLQRLRVGCPEFGGWWTTHDVRPVAGGRKRLFHPTRGEEVFDYASFQANDDPALKLAIYTRV